jgi:hypothetical protein
MFDRDFEAWQNRRLPVDARVLRIKTRHGVRQREWLEMEEALSEHSFADCPGPGPRTVVHCAKFLNRQPGGAADRNAHWLTLAKLQPSDWGAMEHATFMEAVKLAASYDQLNLSNLACMETLLRRAQTIEYVYNERAMELQNNQHQRFGARLTLEEQAAFMVSRTEVSMVSPDLLTHLKRHVKEQDGTGRAGEESAART